MLNDFVFTGYEILVITAEPGDIPPQFNEIHHLAAVPTVLVHPHLRSARHAALRRTVQLRGRHAAY